MIKEAKNKYIVSTNEKFKNTLINLFLLVNDF